MTLKFIFNPFEKNNTCAFVLESPWGLNVAYLHYGESSSIRMINTQVCWTFGVKYLLSNGITNLCFFQKIYPIHYYFSVWGQIVIGHVFVNRWIFTSVNGNTCKRALIHFEVGWFLISPFRMRFYRRYSSKGFLSWFHLCSCD